MLASSQNYRIEQDAVTHCVVCGGNGWAFVGEGQDLCQPDSKRSFVLARCLSCGQIAQTPPPSHDDLSVAYSVKYAPHNAAWKQAGWPLWKVLRQITTQRRVSRLKHYAKGSKLLEVGSGAGDFLYAGHRAGWDVHAVEYSREQAEALRNEFGFDVRAGELTAGLWPEGEFDLIVMWSVLEHLRNPLDVLELASAYLRVGGPVFIQMPTREGVDLGERFGQYWALLDLPRHLNFCSKDSLAQLCDRTGLDLVLYKTPALDTAWCYFASAVNYAPTAPRMQPSGGCDLEPSQ